MKMLKDAALPPWVDVEQPAAVPDWVSPAMPCLPVRDTRGDGDRFEAFALTARAVPHGTAAGGKRNGKYVELRLVRIGMTPKGDGTAVPDSPLSPYGLHQTLAYGAMPLDKFVDRVIPQLGRSPTAYEFTFYEDAMDLVAHTVAGGFYSEPPLIVKVARGIDSTKKPESRGPVGDANMLFVFGEGAKSFKKYARGLRETQNGDARKKNGKYVVRCPMYLDGPCKFVFGYAKRIISHGPGKGVLTEDLEQAMTFESRDAAEKAARKLLGKTYHEMNVVCVDDIPKDDRK